MAESLELDLFGVLEIGEIRRHHRVAKRRVEHHEVRLVVERQRPVVEVERSDR
jgi:hypothetical protein